MPIIRASLTNVSQHQWSLHGNNINDMPCRFSGEMSWGSARPFIRGTRIVEESLYKAFIKWIKCIILTRYYDGISYSLYNKQSVRKSALSELDTDRKYLAMCRHFNMGIIHFLVAAVQVSHKQCEMWNNVDASALWNDSLISFYFSITFYRTVSTL